MAEAGAMVGLDGGIASETMSGITIDGVTTSAETTGEGNAVEVAVKKRNGVEID